MDWAAEGMGEGEASGMTQVFWMGKKRCHFLDREQQRQSGSEGLVPTSRPNGNVQEKCMSQDRGFDRKFIPSYYDVSALQSIQSEERIGDGILLNMGTLSQRRYSRKNSSPKAVFQLRTVTRMKDAHPVLKNAQ